MVNDMIGREGQLSRLTGLIDRAPGGGGAILITGEAGIGKSALIQAATTHARAAGFRVLTCSGVEGETQIGLAGLHELLRVIIDRAEILPERGRAVLFSVFGLGPRIAPDRLELAQSVHGLLTALAAEQPLMITLDDAHWMDQPTISMIAFLVQRVSAAPLVMVVARRPEGAAALDPLGLDEIVLDRLPETDARALVAGGHPELPGRVLRQVLDEAEGNPLALIELARQAAGGRHDTAGSSPRARLERGYAAQVTALPETAQDLLLLVAAANSSSIPDLAAAAERLDLDLGGFREAEKSGLVGLTETDVSFRHPLIRSAVYESAGLHRKVRAHQALAAVLAERDQPSQAAWHRAAATFGYDDEVAQELEDAAAGDSLRGLHGGAMRALERAAALTRDPEQRARRLLRAAHAARLTGMSDDSRRLADRAAEASAGPGIRGERAMILFALDLNSGARTCEPEELLDHGRHLAGAGRADMALALLSSAAFLNRRRAGSPETRDRIGRALDELGMPEADPRIVIARAVLTPGDTPWLRAYADDLPSLPGEFAAGLGGAAEAVQDWPLAARFWSAAAESFRAAGALADSVAVRAEVALALVVQGRLDEALAEAEPVRWAAADGDMPVAAVFAEAVTAHVEAWRGGPVPAVAAHVDAWPGPAAAPIRADIDALHAWAAGLSALIGGDLPTAREALRAAAGHPDVAMLAVADLVEAGLGESVVDDAERLAEATGSPLIRTLVHRAHALLGDDPEENYRRALAVPGAEAFPLQLARTHLLYGEWLHRANRNPEARIVLAAAATAFEQAGAHPWAARAHRSYDRRR